MNTIFKCLIQWGTSFSYGKVLDKLEVWFPKKLNKKVEYFGLLSKKV
jgi:hypothetical protein